MCQLRSKKKIHRYGPFPWKRPVLQNPDRERTNQSTGICLRLGLPFNNNYYCKLQGIKLTPPVCQSEGHGWSPFTLMSHASDSPADAILFVGGVFWFSTLLPALCWCPSVKTPSHTGTAPKGFSPCISA